MLLTELNRFFYYNLKDLYYESFQIILRWLQVSSTEQTCYRFLININLFLVEKKEINLINGHNLLIIKYWYLYIIKNKIKFKFNFYYLKYLLMENKDFKF